LADVRAARNDMKEVRDDACRQERLAMGVEVEAPRIARALSEDFEFVRVYMVAPHSGVHLHVADLGLREDAVQAVEQAVGAPLQGVEHLMRVLAAEATQKDVVFVAMAGACRVLQKEEIGRGAEKDAAAADLDAAGQIEARQVLAFGPDGDLV